MAISPVVTTSTTTGALATQSSTQRHLVRTSDSTLHAFVQMGTNTTKCSTGGLWWLYSTDTGTTWTCGSQLSSDTTTNTQKFADARTDSSDNIYLVYSSSPPAGIRDNTNDVFYRKLSYNGSSSWTVNSAQTILDGSSSTSSYQYSVLELQGTTRIWMASKYFDGTNYAITMYYSDGLGTAPTWTVSQATMNAATTTDSRYHYPTLVRFSTNIALIYNIESGSDMVWRYRADADSLTSWNTQATVGTSTFLVRFPSFSATGDSSGNIYFAASGSSQALFSHYSSSWSTPASITSTSASDSFISVATDGSEVWVMHTDTSGLIGTLPGWRKLVYKKGVAPFAAANFDTNPTAVLSYRGIFDKVWLFDADGSPQYQEETTDAGNVTTADVAHATSGRLLASSGDIVYFGKSVLFDALAWELTTVGSGGTLAYEYCSAVDGSAVCTAWSTLTFTASSGTGLNADGYGAFTPPSDWQASKVNSESTAYYYVRIRTTANFTTGPIGAEMTNIPLYSSGTLAMSTAGVYGIWTENAATGTPIHKVRYATLLTHSTGPFEPSSLGGHVSGLITTDTTPTLTFTLDDPDESDQVKYRIQIDDSSDFSSPAVDYTSALAAQGSASFTVGQAAGSGSYTTGSAGQTLSNASYYWRVKALDNDDEESEYVAANSGSIALIVDTTTWPMAGANPERTSWTSQTLPGDIDAEWVKPIEPLVAQHVQVIGAEDKVYVSTAKGLYAFNATTGADSWVYPTELPLGHSPTYSDGVLYVGGMDKKIHAVDAATGDEVWTYEATGGFTTSPVVANDIVYAGNRDGWFYAINIDDGSLAWKYETGNQILQSAAYKAEDDGIAGTTAGTLFFASNDGYAYALNAATGGLVWKSSSKLPSNGFHAWWPVIYGDDVIFTRTTFGSGGTGEETDYLFCTPGPRPVGCSVTSTWTPGAIGTAAGPWVSGTATLDLNNNAHGMTYADYFETFPHYRNHIYYNMVSGTERAFDIDGDTITDAAPVGWAGDGGTPSPPIVSGYDDIIYFRTMTRASGGFGSKTIGGWDVGTGIISVPFSNNGGQSGGWPGDEPNGMTAAGNKIYWNHCCDRYVGAVDISQPNTDFLSSVDDSNRAWRYVTSPGLPFFDPFPTNIGLPVDDESVENSYYRTAFPYFWSPPHAAVFWNENNKVGPSVYSGKMYAILGNALVAFGVGGAGSSAPMLSTAASVAADAIAVTVTSTDLNEILEDQVQAIVNAGHLKPSYLHSGQLTASSRVRNLDDSLHHYWHNPADLHRVLIRALPFLSAGLQTDVEAYLQDEFADYSPATYAHIGFVDGVQRDPYPYPPNDDDFNSFVINDYAAQTFSTFVNFWTFPPSNLYALWKYAEAGLGNPATLLTAWGSKLEVPIEANYDTVLINGQTVDSDNIRDLMKSFPLVSNGFIAGYTGYIELAKLAGQTAGQYAAYETELTKLLQWKAEDLMTFPDPQDPYVCDQECYYESMITYYNFAYLTPELADYLKVNAGTEIAAILDTYESIAPYWMMAHNGETQGEYVLQPYQQTHSLFQAKALIEEASFDELAKHLDTPIVPVGDLYYIDNVIATLEAGSSSPSPSPTPTPTPSSTPTPTPSSTPTPTPSSSPTPTPNPSASSSPESSAGTQASSTNTSSTAVSAYPECSAEVPDGTAWLYQAGAVSSSSVTIYFSSDQTPVTHYALEYGTGSNSYSYAVSSIGSSEVKSYTINDLAADTQYYFRVRAMNGCAPAAWSNELSARTHPFYTGSQLITTDFVLQVTPAAEEPLTADGVCTTHRVTAGESLWNIARDLLGDGDLYPEIIKLNSNTYPSLSSSTTITAGWLLKIACTEEAEDGPVSAYDVSVQVTRGEDGPVEGAVVTLHSDPKTATTDADGIARFTGVEGGDHTLLISYDGYEGSQSINLTGDTTSFHLTVTVEQKNILLDRRVLLVFTPLVLLIVILSVLLLKKTKNQRQLL